MDHIFLDDQITIPEEFPVVLKNYTKAAIKTNPSDLLSWSLKYFTALSKGENPPVRERLKSYKTENPFMMSKPKEVKKDSTDKLAENVCNSALGHALSLDFDNVPEYPRLTKIICTIGPASEDVDTLVELMEAGMNVVRLNFSHGEHEYHAKVVRNARYAAQEVARQNGLESHSIGIALDTKGPEIRTGLIEGDPSKQVELTKGNKVKISNDKSYFEKCSSELIYVDYENIVKDLKEGNKIYISDGQISLRVTKVASDSLECEVENGSTLGSQKGCNLPGVKTNLPAISEKDKEDLLFGIELDVDMIFASFIRNASGVNEIRKILGDKGKHILIIPKIETDEGVYNIDEIIEASDGIMVARGDLGINIPTEKIFLAQKIMMAKCNIAGKPVICATHMLDSMVKKPRPTRAESSDVANAVFDGADCVMLSAESADGDYPVKCVGILNDICHEVESVLNYQTIFSDLLLNDSASCDSVVAIAIAAVNASMKCSASAIIVLSSKGRSEHLVAKYRPKCPIIAISRDESTTRQCQLYRGIYAVHFTGERLPEWFEDVESRIQFAIDVGKRKKFLKSGNIVVTLFSFKKENEETDTMRLRNVQ